MDAGARHVSTHVAFPELGMATAVQTGSAVVGEGHRARLDRAVSAAVNVTCDPDAAGLALEVRVMEGVAAPASVWESPPRPRRVGGVTRVRRRRP